MANKKTAKKTPKARATSSTAKKNKTNLDSMQVADGKQALAKDINEIKDLEELLGVKQTNPFRTTSGAVLKERMDEMTLTDLQSMAVQVGILPSGNKLSLKTKITKAFKSHAGAGAGYNIGWQRPLVDPSSQAAADILRISREGF